MPRPPTTPVTATVDKGPAGGVVKTHPSFGMARFERISGSSGQLFGSELQHNHFIRFVLSPGESIWRHSEQYYHSSMSRRYVELDMSAAQFAELITSMNVGSGVPCTIRVLNDRQVEGFVDEDNLHEQIKDDLTAKTKVVSDTARDLVRQLDVILTESKLPKAKQETVRKMAEKIVRELDANLPFVLDQYQEAAEKVRAKCAAEVDAMVTHAVQRLGLERLEQLKALGSGDAPEGSRAAAEQGAT